MNWIAHLDTMATILISADVASVCISAVFFSERVRRWTYRKRWGSLPSAIAHMDSIALAAMDDPSGGSIRSQPVTILRNPFDPRAREALTSGMSPHADRGHSHRPTFRKSTVLQRRIAAYERDLASFALVSSGPWEEARPAIPPATGRLIKSRFESFSIGRLQEAQQS